MKCQKKIKRFMLRYAAINHGEKSYQEIFFVSYQRATLNEIGISKNYHH